MHLQSEGGIYFIRFSKPLVHLLLEAGESTGPSSCVQKLLGVSLPSLLETCRRSHGETEEATQQLNLATARAASALLARSGPPEARNLERLLPRAPASDSGRNLSELTKMAAAFAKLAAAVDAATLEERKQWETTECNAEVLHKVLDRMPGAALRAEAKEADLAWEKASRAYTKARLDALLAMHAIRRRVQPPRQSKTAR